MSNIYGNTGGPIPTPAAATNTHVNPPHEPGRNVGPVTMATGGAAAITTLLVGALDRLGVPLSTLEQGAVTVCIIMIAGWAVYPSGRRSK